MDDLARAHIASLEEALAKSNKENVQLHARIKFLLQSTEKRVEEFMGLIDTLHNRIETMVDLWQGEVRAAENLSEEKKKLRVAEIEPFRPLRFGVTKVASDQEPAPAPPEMKSP